MVALCIHNKLQCKSACRCCIICKCLYLYEESIIVSNHETQNVKIINADPSALGLFGLAMVTFVASSQKLGLTSELSFVIPWAIFLGAFAQLFACINDSKRNNTFGTTAFGGYAFFWLGVAASWMIKMGVFGPELASKVDNRQLGVALLHS